MVKFNKYDQFVIEQALELWVEQFENEIKEAEAQGKIPMFGINWPSMSANEIKNKVAALTKKK